MSPQLGTPRPRLLSNAEVIVDRETALVDLAVYMATIKVGPSELAHALGLPNDGIVHWWKRDKRMPSLAWKRAALLWGTRGVTVTYEPALRSGYRLPKVFYETPEAMAQPAPPGPYRRSHKAARERADAANAAGPPRPRSRPPTPRAVARPDDPTLVPERRYVEVDVRAYLYSLGLKHTDVARTLGVSYAALDACKAKGRLPLVVWKRAVELWRNDEHIEASTAKEATRPYWLPRKLYAIPLGVPTVLPKPGTNGHTNGNGEVVPAVEIEILPQVSEPQPPEPPAPAEPTPEHADVEIPVFEPLVAQPTTAPAPTAPDRPAIPWDVYQATVTLLMQQAAGYLAEQAIIGARNAELETRVAYLEAQLGLNRTIAQLDQVALPALGTAPASMRQQVREALGAIQTTNDTKPVLSRLEQRLAPFAGALRQ